MREGGIGREVFVDCFALERGRRLREEVDYSGDFFDYW
jgi:hypothetical protein